MIKSKHFYIRRAHRYLGVLLGLQFLLWTISGLYFSWTNIDEIHGDLQHKHPPQLSTSSNFVSPNMVLNALPEKADSIHQITIVSILQAPFYSIQYFSGNKIKIVLADAQTGKIRPAINKNEAIAIASESFIGLPSVKSVEYITAVGNHNEYREKPLPAWKVSFNHESNTNVYVAASTGKVETFRNNKWRTFDLLWMFHTMDYNGRDNINNWVLRAFSIFGIVTVISGFALFFVSSKRFKKRKIIG
ncbi:MAG: PepSY domain-containing protein [Deinococcales bacterium]|nr:PepSY domain-containing protein [Chitinophagaceae bacterium]